MDRSGFPPRWRPMASISSMKTMHGAFRGTRRFRRKRSGLKVPNNSSVCWNVDFFPGGFSASIRKVIWKNHSTKSFWARKPMTDSWDWYMDPTWMSLIFMVKVGKYTSPMDPMVCQPAGENIKCLFETTGPTGYVWICQFVHQDNLQKTWICGRMVKEPNFGLGRIHLDLPKGAKWFLKGAN